MRTGVLLFIAFFSLNIWAQNLVFLEAVKRTVPFSFGPIALSLEDFHFDSQGSDLHGDWIPGSLEWVRVGQEKLIPRAVLRLNVPKGMPKVQYLGQDFFPDDRHQIQMLVALSSHVDNRISFEGGAGRIQFKPPKKMHQIGIDHTCNSAQLSYESLQDLGSYFGTMGCRVIYTKSDEGIRNQVDVFYWLESEYESKMGSFSVTPYSRKFPISLKTTSNQTTEVMIEGRVADRFHPLSVGFGVGPYSHQNQNRAFGTLYGSYFLNESVRFVSFGAFPFRSQPEVDLGFYVVAEQARTLDERLTVNLLLGAHVLSYVWSGSRESAWSAPQGVEIIIKDAFIKKYSFMMGGFFYPKINDRSYVNTWIRYGNAKLFYEFNFIRWEEPIPNANRTYNTKSFGFSIGFPLLKLL